jgi:hypothetical protein
MQMVSDFVVDTYAHCFAAVLKQLPPYFRPDGAICRFPAMHPDNAAPSAARRSRRL